MADGGFVPEVAKGPFNMRDHQFASGGTVVDPNMAWYDACHPGEPRLDPAKEFKRAIDANLPLDPAEIGAACEALFGPPATREERDYPHGADWVLTTPKKGLWLIVRLPDDRLDRFGYGIETTVMDAVTDIRWATDREARQAAEDELRDALLETLKVIRAQMELAPKPGP